MKYIFPISVKSDFEGYKILIDFYQETKELSFSELVIDFKSTRWFEANLLAILGSILHRIQYEFNKIIICNLQHKQKILFQRNDFLSHFGGYNINNFYQTTIKYKRFMAKEEKLFKDYLDRELLSKTSMPDMSNLLRKKINESIFEIFNNAIIHGKSKYIFTCGQYYPFKKKLDFTIVDLGVTIKKNVVNFLGKNLTGNEAIKWSLKEGNTTRKGTIPGGLGLSLIKEFINLNKGKIQIISADGYCEQAKDKMFNRDFAKVFPGTIVNFEFNIDEKFHYYLSSEIDEEKIF